MVAIAYANVYVNLFITINIHSLCILFHWLSGNHGLDCSSVCLVYANKGHEGVDESCLRGKQHMIEGKIFFTDSCDIIFPVC